MESSNTNSYVAIYNVPDTTIAIFPNIVKTIVIAHMEPMVKVYTSGRSVFICSIFLVASLNLVKTNTFEFDK